MRKATPWVIGLLLLTAGTLSAAPCASSPTTLCLNASRFRVEVSWRDSRDRTGAGQAVPITADTGYFWFFSPTNVELVVKVLDARAVNGKYWVFFGALSSVEYDLKVTDTSNGASKTYHNSLGQFASVGDTSAFSPAAPATASELVEVEGTLAPPASLGEVQAFIDAPPAPAEFSPCPEAAFGFFLNGCRFHIEVSWKDSRGREGDGQPVQLTNDTGYFWFFTPANVELMVKVLDARAVNGKFWVFFGALSNVQYDITVRDSVTGASRRYVNPSGVFASVGDTAAFRGGYSVAPVADPRQATTATLSELGGSVAATGADGTTFTLELPPGALNGPETVTLIPVSRIDRFPFSGGLVAGVEIEPAGRALMLPGTLTIQPPSPPSMDRLLPYSYGRGGEDFILYPRDPDASTLRLPIERLAGYGVGQGVASDAESQAAREPAGPLSPYLQRYAHEVFRKALGLISRGELAARGARIFHEAFDHFFGLIAGQPQLAAVAWKAEPTCPIQERREDLQNILQLERQRQMLGTTSNEDSAALLREILALLHVCQQEALDRCISNTDPFEVLWMLQLARQMQLLGDDDLYFTTFIQDGLLERCLRFELDFESKIVDEFDDSGITGFQRLKYRSQHVPLRFSYGGNFYAERSVWEGACTLTREVSEVEYYPPHLQCTVRVDAGNAWFDAPAAWIGVMEDPTQSAVKLLYDPGYPTVTATATCRNPYGEMTVPYPVLPFASDYVFLHNADIDNQYGLYFASNWDQLRSHGGANQNGEFFAKKSYERTVNSIPTVTTTEETWIFLKHTPDAPMPECP